MGDEREVKSYVVGSSTVKNDSGDYTVISFSEREIDDDPFYKITVVKNCQIVKDKSFLLKEFDQANMFFASVQNDMLGKVEKSFTFEEWMSL